ncbi:MAG: tyrosine--tRNA ligase [Candidatus Moranbacteria bacterium]|nr:tyrosine--tRNA ligase [Candidatus Moranbacteria bacterium]
MPKIITDEKLIDKLLSRGAEEVIVKEELRKKLLSGRKLRIKLGIDPTGSVLHLGHAVVIRKLKEFQDLGHQVIFLIGDFTARIGDPTGRVSARVPMTDADIENNMKNYQEQAGMILDMKKVEVRYNSEWLAKLDLKDLIMLTSKITYAQMAQRADFKERIKKDMDLSIQEFMYPAMQGYDSVALRADVELGGTDQKFNLLMGRQLQKRYNQEPQDVVTCPLLEGLGGKDKMSKSLGNYIALTEEPTEMYGKIMSLTDNLIVNYFNLCTNLSLEEIGIIEKQLKNNQINPRDAKMRLAFEITKIYHGEKKAKKAEAHFEQVFSKKGLPTEIEEIKVKSGDLLINVLVKNKLAESKSDARRKVDQGGIKVDNDVMRDWQLKLDKSFNGKILKAGKREFRKMKIS